MCLLGRTNDRTALLSEHCHVYDSCKPVLQGVVHGSRTIHSVLSRVKLYPFSLILCVNKSQFRDYTHLPYLPSNLLLLPGTCRKVGVASSSRNMSGRKISRGPVNFSSWLLKLVKKNCNLCLLMLLMHALSSTNTRLLTWIKYNPSMGK